jgi:hypothetical protein
VEKVDNVEKTGIYGAGMVNWLTLLVENPYELSTVGIDFSGKNPCTHMHRANRYNKRD